MFPITVIFFFHEEEVRKQNILNGHCPKRLHPHVVRGTGIVVLFLDVKNIIDACFTESS